MSDFLEQQRQESLQHIERLEQNLAEKTETQPEWTQPHTPEQIQAAFNNIMVGHALQGCLAGRDPETVDPQELQEICQKIQIAFNLDDSQTLNEEN